MKRFSLFFGAGPDWLRTLRKHRPAAWLLPIALCLAGSAPVQAELRHGPLSFSAFGTLGGAWLSNQQVDYQQGTQPSGPGRSHDFDLGLDSRLGGQLNIAPTASTLLTAQSVVERLADNEFQPRLTQANLRQEVGEHLTLRVGRIQSPTFLASDYRLANFSNPWARTPGVLYNLYPLTHLDSAEFTARQHTPFGTLNLNSGYGRLSYPFPTGDAYKTTDLHLDDVLYANMKLEEGPWQVKLSWLRARVTSKSSRLEQIGRGVALLDPIAAQGLRAGSQSGALYSIGVSYDASDLLVMAEWGLTRTDRASVLADKHGGYVTVGYHLDRWLPQITLGYQAVAGRRLDSANPQADAILSGLHNLQRTDYRSLALGVSYALEDFAMLRGQVDLIDPKRDSRGPYIQPTSHYDRKDPGVDVLFSLTLDFIY